MSGDKAEELLDHPQPDTAGNFGSTYSVILDYPLDQVYSKLAYPENIRAVIELSSFAGEFKLLDSDHVKLTVASGADSARFRTAPPVQGLNCGMDAHVLSRQFFTFVETVPIAFGLAHRHVQLAGSQVWDDASHTIIYETVGQASGIIIWKLRQFEALDDAPSRTRVSERIEGHCPALIKAIVEHTTRKGHRFVHFNIFKVFL
jgi:hypothetical protein